MSQHFSPTELRAVDDKKNGNLVGCRLAQDCVAPGIGKTPKSASTS